MPCVGSKCNYRTLLLASCVSGGLILSAMGVGRAQQMPPGGNGGGSLARMANLPREMPIRSEAVQVVHRFTKQMPVGVAVTSTGRMFISYPRWEDQIAFTLAELKNGREVPYPQAGDIQMGHKVGRDRNMVSLQGLLVDPQDRLWVLDTSTINMKPLSPFVPKLICIDTKTNRVTKTIKFPAAVVPPGGYINDLRIDLRRGQGGVAYITDSGKKPGIVVVDLASGKSWKRLADHPSVKAEPGFVGVVEGRSFFKRPKPGVAQHVQINADGIAISPDGERLYYTPLSSRRLYSVSCDALADENKTDADVAATVKDMGGKGVADGMKTDSKGRIYTTNWEHNAILRRLPNGAFETVVHDPRLLWPDTLDISRDGYLYILSNQLHRQGGYNGGKDRRQRPFLLTRVKIDAGPVLLGQGAKYARTAPR